MKEMKIYHNVLQDIKQINNNIKYLFKKVNK